MTSVCSAEIVIAIIFLCLLPAQSIGMTTQCPDNISIPCDVL